MVGINVGTYEQTRIQTENGQVTTRQRSETIANTAVSALSFVHAVEAMRRAVILSSGAQMRELQERLSTRGLYTARIDGSYGPALKAAIEAYEGASRLPVTGLASRALLGRLAQEPAQQGTITPSSASEPRR